MSAGAAGRRLFAGLVGAALPHATDGLWRLLTAGAGLSAGWTQAFSWVVVGLPAAWLVAHVAGRPAWPCALAAAAGGLLALAAPFVVYQLPFGGGALRLLALPIVVHGLAWPALILLLAQRRTRH